MTSSKSGKGGLSFGIECGLNGLSFGIESGLHGLEEIHFDVLLCVRSGIRVLTATSLTPSSIKGDTAAADGVWCGFVSKGGVVGA